MKNCPNCGWSNEDANRFCENCGADFSGLAAAGQRAATPTSTWSTPQPYASDQQHRQNTWDVPPSSPDWRMAPLPAEEAMKPRGRRVWLWLLGILLMGCLLICVAGGYWIGYTDSGKSFQTEVSDRATEEAQ